MDKFLKGFVDDLNIHIMSWEKTFGAFFTRAYEIKRS